MRAESDPDRLALRSIDAVHSANPEIVNEQVARLRRFVRIRRPLYYSVLAPFGTVGRFSPLLVLITGALAVVGTVVAGFMEAPGLVMGALMYWGLGGLLYHALSVRLAALIDDASTSVGLAASDVLAMWMD